PSTRISRDCTTTASATAGLVMAIRTTSKSTGSTVDRPAVSTTRSTCPGNSAGACAAGRVAGGGGACDPGGAAWAYATPVPASARTTAIAQTATADRARGCVNGSPLPFAFHRDPLRPSAARPSPARSSSAPQRRASPVLAPEPERVFRPDQAAPRCESPSSLLDPFRADCAGRA